MSDYAARIRAARAYKDITQKELAELLGTSEQSVKRRESGEQQPKRGDLLAIAAACEVPFAFMENGFGIAERDEILERMDRVEAALLASDVEHLRDLGRSVISELGEGDGEAAGGSAPRSPRRARGPRRSASS